MDPIGEDRGRTLREKVLELIGSEQFDEALPLAREVVAEVPEDSGNHVLLGICLSQTDRARDAEKEFFEALRLDPSSQRAYYNLAVHCARTGELARASDYAKRSLALDIGHRPTHELMEWIREAGNEATEVPEEEAPETDPWHTPPSEESERWPPESPEEKRAAQPPDPRMTGGLVAEAVHPLRPRLSTGWTVAGWAIAIGAFSLQIPIVMFSFQTAAAMLAESPNMGFTELMASAERNQATQPAWLAQVSFSLVVLSFAALFWITVDVRDRAAKQSWSLVQMAAALLACAGCGVAAWLMVPLYMVFGRPK